MASGIGRRVVDVSPLLSVFEAQEGEVQQIIGKTGMGKTYEATRRAWNYLRQGYIVYTTWKLNLPDYFDERDYFRYRLRNFIFGRKHFYRFNLKENWKHVNLRDFEDEHGIIDTEKLARFLATRTDCIFMLDEGQDVFDSNKKSGQIARQSITRTRHMHKTLILISQRAQAVDVNVRANSTYFYKCEKRNYWFLPTRFRVYRTDEIDESSNYPIWVRHNSVGEVTWKAPLWYSAFASKRIYDLYDSWYMRQEMIRSQDLHIEAYELSFFERFMLLMGAKKGSVRPPNDDTHLSPHLPTPSPIRLSRPKIQ